MTGRDVAFVMAVTERQAEVLAAYCHAHERVHREVGYHVAADCFCGQGGFWRLEDGVRTDRANFTDDGVVTDIAVGAIKSAAKALRAANRSRPEAAS